MAQSEMNRCADLDARQADADSEPRLSGIAVEAPERRQCETELRTAQRAWLAFRDAHLQELYPAKDKQGEYGSMYPCAMPKWLQR
jgi:uncharacterized protein YecT (DUF1311 family)